MNPLTVLRSAVDRLANAADRLDVVADDLERSRGRVTVVGRVLKLGATAVGIGAVAFALVDLVLDGPLSQRLDPAVRREIAKAGKAQGSLP